MSIVILIPALLCLIALYRGNTQTAFLDVYLPTVLLLPLYYYWKVPMLPPIDFGEAVLLPLGLAMILRDLQRWKFTLSDLWVLLFVITSFVTDYVTDHNTAATFDLFSNIASVIIPYMAGKLLIEQFGHRVATLRRFVFLLAVACVISVYEYRMERNPFMMFWSHFFPGQDPGWHTQIRWGFGRVAGPYGQSELAGMVFFTGLVFALWLAYGKHWEEKFRGMGWLPFRKGNLLVAIIGAVLLMAQARGPWLGAMLALAISLTGRAARIGRTAIIVAVIGSSVGYVSFRAFTRYLSAPTTTIEQQNAQYRGQLLPNYIPIAIKGGAFGWGRQVPHVKGQVSIDNEYLFVDLTQGYLGLAAFVLMSLDAMLRLVLATARAADPEERYFSLSLLGVIAGILLTAATVFLGNQAYQMFFLLIGWSQSIQPAVKEKEAAFLLEKVYT